MSITTEFDLEPVLQAYFQKYPNGRYEGFTVVFKTENEHAEGEKSYIVVFNRRSGTRVDRISFRDFLDSYCKVNNLVAVAEFIEHILPKFGHSQLVLGNTERLQDKIKK